MRRLYAWTFALVAAALGTAPLLCESPPVPSNRAATGGPAPNVVSAAQPARPPKEARQHLQSQYRRAWESLSSDERKELWELFQQVVGPEMEKAIAEHGLPSGASSTVLSAGSPASPAPALGGWMDLSVSAFPTSGRAPLWVNFSASAFDPSASYYDYFWDFGDGTAGYGSDVGHTYGSPGTYVATVYVSDDIGGSGSDSMIIDVAEFDGNYPPQVSAAASPTWGRAPLSVQLSANASDPDGSITSFAWTFGDGATSSVQNPLHTYQAPGSYLASVTVFDNAGASATSTVSLEVAPPLSSGPDDDLDGLPDGFERQLADKFTPIYFLSAFEYPGVGLAQFEDRPDAMVATQIFPTSFPPTVTGYFRVTPLAVHGGQSYVQIDYLTPWNRDTGMALSGACFTDVDILSFFGIVPSLGILIDGHTPDPERSALRVVAPAMNGGYNTDPSAYIVDRMFMAAHEDTVFDHSSFYYIFYLGPPSVGVHFTNYLSLSKHATYFGWPHGMPLFPWWLIDSIYAGVDFACSWVSASFCNWLYFIADEVVYDCVTEKHVPQLATFSREDLRLNVGELDHPLPGGSFIQYGLLHDHLLKRFAVP